MQVAIVFTSYGCCSALGNFAPQDSARVDAALARHLVEEAHCARYADTGKNSEPVATLDDPAPAVVSKPARQARRKVKTA
jgi:hypothetical protein